MIYIIEIVVLKTIFSGYITANILCSLTDIEEIKFDLFENQNIAGKIFANAFYSIAWIIKFFEWSWKMSEQQRNKILEYKWRITNYG